jgi:hypothetical protein
MPLQVDNTIISMECEQMNHNTSNYISNFLALHILMRILLLFVLPSTFTSPSDTQFSGMTWVRAQLFDTPSGGKSLKSKESDWDCTQAQYQPKFI